MKIYQLTFILLASTAGLRGGSLGEGYLSMPKMDSNTSNVPLTAKVILNCFIFYKKTLSPMSAGLVEMPPERFRIPEHIFLACSSSQ
jgi:hypothetical protein